MDDTQKTQDQERKDDRKKKIAVAAAAIFLILVLFLAYRATRSEPAAPFENAGIRVSNIKATLDPPFTHYEVFTSDVTANLLNFTWTLQPDAANAKCLTFTWSGPKADWRHDGDGCSHNGPAEHPGTITVVVTDGTHTVTRKDTHGAADVDPNPLYP